MKTLNLRQLFADLQRMPHYLPAPNKISPAEGAEIAARFGEYQPDTQQDFDLANKYGQERMTRPDLNGNGVGLYLNAERLYFGYLYDMHYCAHCESAEAARHDDYAD